MSKTIRASVALVLATLLGVTGASAETTDNDMREVRELVLELQDQIAAQQEEIATQREALEAVGVEDERGSSSRISSFLETTDFSGWVAASYFYNFNDPKKNGGGGNAPTSPYSNPVHQDPNGFQFDEAWFVIDKPATDESPAGYHFEMTYGATGSAIANGNPGGNDVWVQSANVSYQTPLGPTITAGKFGTVIGYEVLGAPSNVNITRGFTFNLFQPFSQIGVLVSQDLEGGFTYTIGAVNGVAEEQPDTNQSKGLMWQLGWGNDQATVLFNGLYTPNNEGAPNDLYILNGLAEFTPTDNILTWADLTYVNSDIGPGNPWVIGLALGGRIGLTEKMGIGGRFEYAHFSDDGTGTNFVAGPAGGDGDLYSATITTDYALTENLTWKVEGKYEAGEENYDNAYASGGSGFSDDAFWVGTQLYYEF